MWWSLRQCSSRQNGFVSPITRPQGPFKAAQQTLLECPCLSALDCTCVVCIDLQDFSLSKRDGARLELQRVRLGIKNVTCAKPFGGCLRVCPGLPCSSANNDHFLFISTNTRQQLDGAVRCAASALAQVSGGLHRLCEEVCLCLNLAKASLPCQHFSEEKISVQSRSRVTNYCFIAQKSQLDCLHHPHLRRGPSYLTGHVFKHTTCEHIRPCCSDQQQKDDTRQYNL